MRLAFWRRPPTERQVEEMDWARLSQEMLLYSTPYMAQGGNQPPSNRLLASVTGASAIAVRAISDRISGLELEVVARRRVRDGTVEDEVLDTHPLKLLLDNPSQWHSGRQMKRLIGHFIPAVGEAYIGKITGGATGRIPERLQIMDPSSVQPVGDGANLTGYEVYSRAGQRVQSLTVDEVCRIWNPDPESMMHSRGVLGSQARLSDMLEFSESHLRGFYENDATPPVMLEATAESAQAPQGDVLKRFMKSWVRSYHSRKGTRRGIPPFLAPGWTAKVLDAAQTLRGTRELMEYARDAMLMSYGVPRSVVGDVVDANRAAAETNAYVFDLHTVKPITEAISDAFTRDLASMYPQRSGIQLMVRFEDFVAADKEHELKRESQDLQLKVRSVNQVRTDRGEDEVTWGDLPVGGFNDTPYDGTMLEPMEADEPEALGVEPEDDEPEPDPPEEIEEERHLRIVRGSDPVMAEWKRVVRREKRYVPQMRARMRRVFDRQEEAVLKRLKHMTPRSRVEVSELFGPDTEWGRLFAAQIEPIRQQALRFSALEALELLDTSQSFVFTEAVQGFLDREGAALVRNVNETTRRRLQKQLLEANLGGESVDEIAKRVRSVFDVRRHHARTIARTEILKASQAGQIEGLRQSGVVEKKQWNTSRDDAVRDEHVPVDGQVTDLDGVFVLGDGETASAPGLGPGGSSLSAHNAINCRCFVTPVFEALG